MERDKPLLQFLKMMQSRIGNRPPALSQGKTRPQQAFRRGALDEHNRALHGVRQIDGPAAVLRITECGIKDDRFAPCKCARGPLQQLVIYEAVGLLTVVRRSCARLAGG